MVYIRPAIDKTIAHMPGVKEAVHSEADEIGARARSNLAAHRAEGEAEIQVDHRNPDAWVSLVDPAAVSIEYGRSEYTRDGVTVGAMDGLYIIHRAAGL